MADIQLSRDFSLEFAELQRRTDRGEGEAKYLLMLIEKGIAKLTENYQAGQKIQNRLWPKHYIQRYGITNLWRLRLDDYWRMIYTLIGEKVRIIAVILEVLDHKEYNKRFGYK